MGVSARTANQDGWLTPLRRLPVVLTMVLGLLATIGVSARIVSTERRVARLDFENTARSQLALINTDLQNADALLATLRAYVETSNEPPSRDKFERFSRMLRKRTVGLRSVGWAPRVTVAERERFEQTVRQAGLPNFQIRELGPDGKLVPAGNRAEYYPVVYADPGVDPNALLGFDLISTSLRKAAVDRAIMTNGAAATLPLMLVGGDRPRGGIAAFLPVVSQPPDQDGVAKPPAGLIFGGFEIYTMVETIIREKNLLRDLDIYLYDPTGPVEDRMVYWDPAVTKSGPPSESSLLARPHWEGRVSIIDQSLVAIFLPHGDLNIVLWQRHVVMPPVLALLLTAMAVAYLWTATRRTYLLEALTCTLSETTDQLHRNAEALSLQSRHDALTGLPNRRAFSEELARMVARVQRGRGCAAVLLLDLDKFKPINDLHGHGAGDQVLCEVASRVRSVIRGTDVVARLGGDEFAVIMEYDQTSDAPAKLARRIIAAVGSPSTANGVTVEVGASIGIAICPQDGVEPAQLLHAADLAMYRVKRQGRGTFCRFEPSMDTDLRDRASLEQDFRRALAEGEIHPYFQPVVQLRDGRLQGFEILARWHHPTRGLIGPDVFIPVAEESGLLPDMTYGLLRRACAAARNWPDHLFLAVNISPVHLRDTTLMERLMAILGECRFSSRRLEVEITEAALVTDVEVARTALLAMQTAGMRIALDDFGTGYSNLALLRQLSFDKIKIDRTFVLTMQTDAGSAKIVEAILSLSKSFGVITTAEGIESCSVASDLTQLGCEFGQGYFFGRPMPAEELKVAAAFADRLERDEETARAGAEDS